MTMFSRAIARQPASTMVNGITTATLGVPDFQKAQQQHQAYVSALKACGLDVTVLEALVDYPDSVFIEDVALLAGNCAILTRPGAGSRIGEVEFVNPGIRQFYETVDEIKSPGSVEAGDVMMVASHFYIGLSARTNTEGARQLIEILNRHGMTGSTVKMNEFLHLKTGLSYLENNILLISGEFVNRAEFSKFNQIIVDEDEGYAANSVWINDRVLTPAGYPRTSRKIKAAGYQVIELDMSEFQKLDGGLSCLSLRF